MNAFLLPHRCLLAGLTTGLLLGSAVLAPQAVAAGDPSIVLSEIIAPDPPSASSHASTIAETPDGLVAAWFGGSREGALDVSIWLSRHDGTGWSQPEEVANGTDVRQGRRFPCWNPVLVYRRNGDLLLFYKVGPSPSTWWGMVRVSPDNGQTWVRGSRLPSGYVGPVRNKPIEMFNGTLLCGSSSEDRGWRVRMEWAKDPFGIWNCTPYLNAAFTVSAIQPTILKQDAAGSYQILCRSKQGKIVTAWSTTNGNSWSPMDRTTLPNPNSAIDAVTLADRRHLLVYNHTAEGRGVLNVALSLDGKLWQAVCELENEPGSEFSYPAVIQTKDGLVHVTYTWKRERIKHVVLDPAQFQMRRIVDGVWPAP